MALDVVKLAKTGVDGYNGTSVVSVLPTGPQTTGTSYRNRTNTEVITDAYLTGVASGLNTRFDNHY